MNIENLTEFDLVALSELFRQFWAEESNVEKIRATYSRIVSNPAYIFLSAKQEDHPAGFGVSRPIDRSIGY